ncbi:dockerin type I domain-containing protein [Patescibacteria group bacterium]|jgi:hypothetical protein|nr:dockerin type I domain-containing protein [Patescibacteria group bacterium]
MSVRVKHVLISCGVLPVVVFFLVFLYQYSIRAADGSGTNVVTPTTAQAGQTGRTFTFTFTAAESMGSGEVAITAPAPWTAPQGTSGVAGYTTVNSTLGTIGNVLDAGDSTSGWSAGSACANGVTADTATKHEGTASIRCANGNESNNDRWYKNIATQNWSGYTRVGFWIHSTAAISNGNLRFAYDNSANITTPHEQISFGSTIPANTWTYVVLNFTTTASARASVASFGFVIRSPFALDNVTVRMDDLLIGPGSPTFPGGGDVRFRILQLNAGQTATITYGAGGGTSGVTIPIIPGVYTFLTKTRSSDAGISTNIGTSPTVTIAAPATRFVIDDPVDGTVDAPIPVTVRALNAFGGLDTAYQNDVTLAASGAATGEGLVNIVNGIGTAQLSDTIAETVVLTLSDTQGTGLSVTSTQDVVFSPGGVASFSLNDPGDLVAGERAAYHVVRRDQHGNLVTTGATTVFLSSNSTGGHAFYDAPTNGGVITSFVISSGTSTGSFWYQDERAGDWTVTASDNATAPDGAVGIDDAADPIRVQPAAPAQLFLSDPGNMTAGTRVQYEITRQDRFGNAASSSNTTVYLYTSSTSPNAAFFTGPSGGSPISSITIANGTSIAQAWYYDEKAENWTITASDNASAPDGAIGLSDGVDGIVVSASTTSRFILNDPGDMVANSRIGYTVSREDAYGNPVTSGLDSVYLSSNSNMGSASFYGTSTGGIPFTLINILPFSSSALFWYFDNAPGTWTITASDNSFTPDGAAGIDDASENVLVTPAPIVATRFVIEHPINGSVDAPISVTVKAVDENGDVQPDYQQDVTLAASGAATGEGLVDIVDGVGTRPISDAVAEIVTLSLQDTETTGLNTSSTQDVFFAPGAVAQLGLTSDGFLAAGETNRLTVSRSDQYGNPVTSTNTDVYLYTNSIGAARFLDAPSAGAQIVSLVIPNGTSTAQAWYYDEKAGNWTITASDNAMSPDGASGLNDSAAGLTVAPGPTALFALSDAGDMLVGTRAGYVVTRKDAFANPVTDGTQDVFLFTNSVGTSTAFYDAASNGSMITNRTFTAGISDLNFWYQDSATGTWAITVSDNVSAPDGTLGVDDDEDLVIVQDIPIVATRFVILNPDDAQVGTPVIVTVQAQDNNGNVDTTYQNDVFLALDGSASGTGLVNIINGVGTRTITDLVAQNVELSLQDTQGTGLDVSSIQHVTFSIAPPSGTSASEPRGGGSGAGIPVAQVPVGVRISGIAYLGATIKASLRDGGREQPLIERKANASDGTFSFVVNGNFTGSQTIGVTVIDRNGETTPTRYFSPIYQGGILAEKIIPVVPTVKLDSIRVAKGQPLEVSGYASLHTRIELSIDNKVVRTTFPNPDSSYAFSLDTTSLALGGHSAKVLQKFDDGIASDYSLQRSFSVTTLASLDGDLNGDGRVDISDWSAFLAKWQSEDNDERLEADVNKDGKTDIEDFSIFVRNIHI